MTLVTENIRKIKIKCDRPIAEDRVDSIFARVRKELDAFDLIDMAFQKMSLWRPQKTPQGWLLHNYR